MPLVAFDTREPLTYPAWDASQESGGGRDLVMDLLYFSGSMASVGFFSSQGLYLGVPFNPLEANCIAKLRKELSSWNTAWPQWDLDLLCRK